MSLVNPLCFIKEAQKKGCAIATFNIHNLETIQAVAQGAKEENCPVIIQTTPGTLKHAGIPCIASIVKEASKEYKIPMALHVDHCKSFETIMQCMKSGYTSVMIDSADLPYEENVKMVKKVVEAAHSINVCVEGELGRIGGTEDDMSVDERTVTFTVPKEAEDFVSKTGIDTLAIAIGTAHGEYKGIPDLDFLSPGRTGGAFSPHLKAPIEKQAGFMSACFSIMCITHRRTAMENIFTNPSSCSQKTFILKLLYIKIQIRYLSFTSIGRCPRGSILPESTSSPLLTHSSLGKPKIKRGI